MPESRRAEHPKFPSFFMGGFECTYALTKERGRLDLLKSSRHDQNCRSDYQLLKEIGITTVREGLSWHQIDQGNGLYDFARFEEMMRVGQDEQVKQIWDLNHFDYPERLDPFSQEFIDAYEEYAKRCVDVIQRYQTGTIYVVPSNEISFWGYVADVGMWAPFRTQSGLAFKTQLVKAAIRAMDAIWSVNSDVRFIQVDPLFYRRAKDPITDGKKIIEDDFKARRFYAWDMLCGKFAPELGGHPKYLDIIGANYYIHNQEWIVGEDILEKTSYEQMDWDSPARISLATMLSEVYERYQRPVLITESGSTGDLRGKWWKRTLDQIDEAKQKGVPILGVCAYPIIDQEDWDDGHLTHPGLWDFKDADESCKRIPHKPSIKIITDYANRRSH